jgi:hypothetical protein
MIAGNFLAHLTGFRAVPQHTALSPHLFIRSQSCIFFSHLAFKHVEEADFGRFLMYPQALQGARQAGNHGLIEEQSRHPGGCFDDFPPRLN